MEKAVLCACLGGVWLQPLVAPRWIPALFADRGVCLTARRVAVVTAAELGITLLLSGFVIYITL